MHKEKLKPRRANFNEGTSWIEEPAKHQTTSIQNYNKYMGHEVCDRVLVSKLVKGG